MTTERIAAALANLEGNAHSVADFSRLAILRQAAASESFRPVQVTMAVQHVETWL